MAVKNQVITNQYAIYNSDCIEVLKDMPPDSMGLSIYSPPFGGLYHYSSDERDLSNCDSYEDFFHHYDFVIREIARVTKPGRMKCVHCMDVPTGNSGKDSYLDFPGDIIAHHKAMGFDFKGRRAIWKEPLAVRLRTMQKNLQHNNLCEDSINSGIASADYVLFFAKRGENAEPVAHPAGLLEYAGERKIPADLLPYRGWAGKQTENRYSHWIWRQYASSFWDDIRMNHVLPYESAGHPDDEKHVHPLQLDVIDRCVTLYSNKGDTVLTPFMGVGSEVYSPVMMGRKAIGIELKESYFRQAMLNCDAAAKGYKFDVKNKDLIEELEAQDL